jgi:hypothetical protein
MCGQARPAVRLDKNGGCCIHIAMCRVKQGFRHFVHCFKLLGSAAVVALSGRPWHLDSQAIRLCGHFVAIFPTFEFISRLVITLSDCLVDSVIGSAACDDGTQPRESSEWRESCLE